MKVILAVDSSANMHGKVDAPVARVPLKIIAGNSEYVDTDALDVQKMLVELKAYKGRSSTACPNVDEWLNAFGDADWVFGVAITSGLSGCYNAARLAAEQYMKQKPGAKVFILDSLSTGPEMQVILEKYDELLKQGLSFEEIVESIQAYAKHTHLLFSLSSLDNFVKNGRVNPILGKAVGLLGIRIIGRASESGTLEVLNKARGEKKAQQVLMSELEKAGYRGGKLRMSHTFNEPFALTMKETVCAKWPQADVTIVPNRGLCSYYAETGGLLLGFEDDKQ